MTLMSQRVPWQTRWHVAVHSVSAAEAVGLKHLQALHLGVTSCHQLGHFAAGRRCLPEMTPAQIRKASQLGQLAAALGL